MTWWQWLGCILLAYLWGGWLWPWFRGYSSPYAGRRRPGQQRYPRRYSRGYRSLADYLDRQEREEKAEAEAEAKAKAKEKDPDPKPPNQK